MAKTRRAPDPRQMTIDDYIAMITEDTLPEKPENGSCDVAPQLRGILNEVIRESQKSRDEIAELMTRALGLEKEITKSQIDGWTREDGDRYIPLEYMPAFEQICDSRAVTEYLCKFHGGRFIDKRRGKMMDLGQVLLLEDELAARKKQLKKGLSR